MVTHARRTPKGPSPAMLADTVINELLREAIGDLEQRPGLQKCGQGHPAEAHVEPASEARRDLPLLKGSSSLVGDSAAAPR
jgi:hypothetical protein